MPIVINNSDDLSRKRDLIRSRQKARQFYGFGVLPAKEIKVCSGCGTICMADENHCSNCGASLPQKNLYELSVEDAKRCQHCDAILLGNENFCPICGTNLQAKS